MEQQFFTEIARFRILSYLNIESKRAMPAVYKSIDAALARIGNSIQRGYTLQDRTNALGEIQRRYPYFEVIVSEIHSQVDLKVIIRRGDISIAIDEDTLPKLLVWVNKWKPTKKPNTIEELQFFDPNQRWW